MNEPQDRADLVVVGAGAAGMTAAIVAAHAGLRVVLCEASQQVGGTTATSAGTLWIPGNRHGRVVGHGDTIEAADRYLQALASDAGDEALRRAFLSSAGEAIDWLEQHSQVQFASSGVHPDYLVRPGAALAGRAISPLAFDGRQLGRHFSRIRPPIAEFMLLGGMMVGKADIQSLIRRWSSVRAFAHSARLVIRYAMDRLRYARGTRLVMGNALVARLYASVLDAQVEVRFGWWVRELQRDAGRVTGAIFDTDAGPRGLASNHGVVLATGGVGHHARLRRELLPRGGETSASLACESVVGEGISAGMRAGGAMERHAQGNFFWQPVSRVQRPGGGLGLFPHLFLDRAKPGLIAVDDRGRRFVNEASSYHHFIEGMFASGHHGAWLVCDATFVCRYGLGVIPPGTRDLARWATSGYVELSESVRDLALRLGADPDTLAASVSQANSDAASGTDVAFGKGEAPLDRFNGDPEHGPNPCLGPIKTKPFVALRILPADAASSAGLSCDAFGRVLNEQGEPMPGLYACGNDAASVMRGTYPGPGATLGPAIVFGYCVGRHAAQAAATGPLHFKEPT